MSLIQAVLARFHKTEAADPFALRLDRIQSRERRHRVRAAVFRAFGPRLATSAP